MRDLSMYQSINQSIVQAWTYLALAGHAPMHGSVGWLIDWLTRNKNRHNSVSFDFSGRRLFPCAQAVERNILTSTFSKSGGDKLDHWLIDWLIDHSFDWLIDWLIQVVLDVFPSFFVRFCCFNGRHFSWICCSGYVEVNKIQGNLHIAPGNTFNTGQSSHSHVHNLIPYEARDVNTSHFIHHFSYGQNYPGRVDPLDDLNAVAKEGAMMFSYYTKIVPTMYVAVSNSTTKTYQYSVTTHKKSLARGSGEKGLPGLFVYYELSPIMVKMEEHWRSTMHFLTSCCAIIGGLFTVAGIVDAMIYQGQRVLLKRLHGAKGNWHSVFVFFLLKKNSSCKGLNLFVPLPTESSCSRQSTESLCSRQSIESSCAIAHWVFL